jgi:hypothetical protein
MILQYPPDGRLLASSFKLQAASLITIDEIQTVFREYVKFP